MLLLLLNHNGFYIKDSYLAVLINLTLSLAILLASSKHLKVFIANYNVPLKDLVKGAMLFTSFLLLILSNVLKERYCFYYVVCV
jgi:hypothetical protein